MKREVLFNHKWLRVVKLDGWFVASEPAQSKYNRAVAVLPWRKKQNSPPEFLSRFELNPAHMDRGTHQPSIITGACETGKPLYHAQAELYEEGGYAISQSRFKYHGYVCPLKASCTKLHLYSIRIIGRDKQVLAQGDGGEHEQKEFVDWVSREEMIYAKDPYIHTIIMRAGL